MSEELKEIILNLSFIEHIALIIAVFIAGGIWTIGLEYIGQWVRENR